MRTSLHYTRYLTAGLVAALLLITSACGFHLRSDVQLASQLQKIHIQGGSPYDPLVRELGRALGSAGATVIDDPQSATAVLYILKNTGTRRVLSVRATGKVQEYELYQALSFGVRDAAGVELLPAQQLEVTREYVFDANDVLSESTEEDALRREMRRDLVRLAMLRLEALGR